MQYTIYLEIHEVHQLGDFWLQDFNRLLVDLNSVGLLIAFHLKIKPRNLIKCLEVQLDFDKSHTPGNFTKPRFNQVIQKCTVQAKSLDTPYVSI